MGLSTEEPVVRVCSASKWLGGIQILKDVDLQVHEGDVVGLLGPSGSGKSTLLRCIGLLLEVDSGGIYLDGHLLGFERHGQNMRPLSGRAIAKQRAQMAMVFQTFNLFSHMSALRNVTLGPSLAHGIAAKEAEERAIDALDSVGLAHLRGAYPHELSGGQQQRVAIARAIAMEPRVILFDEPTSALDPELVGGVLRSMEKLAAQGLTMIVVTHEMAFARRVADHLFVMNEGVIIEEGSPNQVLDSPNHARTREFLSHLL